jgi:type II secretory pathway pseudopilin PulG
VIGLRERFETTRRSGDAGIAIVAAMAVVMLVGIMLAVVVTVALSEATQTGRDRQRSSAVSVAEGQVDTVSAQIQSSTPSALAALCGTISGSKDVGADDFGLETDVTYYTADGADAGTDPDEVDCAAVETTPITQAKVVTRATSDAINGTLEAERSVETLLELTPTYAMGLDKALFADSNMTVSNNAMLTSASGKPDADIYTNGSFYCRNNQEFFGSIHAQGGVFLESQCTVHVDAWAKGEVRVTNPSASIGGDALSSTSNVSLDKAQLTGQARAKGTVTGTACNTAGKCAGNQTVDDPPMQPFPQLEWTAPAAAEWVAAGYTNTVQFPMPSTDFQCGWYNGADLYGPDGKKANLNGKATGPAAWLFANSWKLPANTIVIVNCPSDKITFQGVPLLLNKDLIVVSRLGITMSNQTQISSVAGTGTAEDPNLLYLIQPYKVSGQGTWTTYSCSGDGIALDNQVTVDKTVNTLLYSPCTIRKANKSEIVGQVYSGSAMSIDNQLDMKYIPMPIWGGLANSSDSIESYSINVLYKREAL